MKMCEYEIVTNSNQPLKGSDEGHDRSWKPFLRQLLIVSCVWSVLFQFGLCFGATTVIIPRMREERGENYVTRDMASWISSAVLYAGVPWVPVTVFLSSAIGRRNTFALSNIASLVGFAVLSVGDTPHHVLAAMIIQGSMAGLTSTNCLLVVSEYTSPLYRGVFFTGKSASLYWGVWVGNAIGTVTHWHYIAWLGLVCAIYNLVTLFVWPESPYWLASKGRLDQCQKAHHWLKGRAPSSERELKELIKGNQSECSKEDEFSVIIPKQTAIEKLKHISLDMNSKCFYKSLLFTMALGLQYQFTGKAVCTVYSIEIIKGITNSKHEAYKGMLILDGVTVLGMYVGCGLSKKLKRRMLLISAGGAGSLFLLIMSIYLYLVRFEVILESKYLTLALLTCYSLSISCGPIILNYSLTAELLPLHRRDTATIIVALVNNILSGTTLKIGPYIFYAFGSDGAFFFYAITSSTLLFILYVYLPETKDKTLKEIQDLILGTRTESKSEPREMIEYNFESKEV